jgi:hypothetical protein
MPLPLARDDAIEWLKGRCKRITSTETWALYYGPDRRVIRSAHFTGPRGELPREEPGEYVDFVYLEGPPSGDPIEILAIHGLLRFFAILDSLEDSAEEGPTEYWVIDCAGHAWNTHQAMDAYLHRKAQCKEAHRGVPLDPVAELDWIEDRIRRERQS